MNRVLAVPAAVLPEFQLRLRVAAVLMGGVVAPFALRALELQFDSYVTGHFKDSPNPVILACPLPPPGITAFLCAAA